MKTAIYMREGDWYEQEERLAAKQYFETVPVRTSLPKNSLVIPRYSALPFYKELEQDCANLESKLINSYQEHLYVADILNWYEDLKDITPLTLATWYLPSMSGSWVVKGKTNSRKHQWKNRMFAKTAQDIPRVVSSLYEDDLIASQGVVVRQYVPLVRLGEGINDMPVSHEWRFFILDQQILAAGYYWASEPDTDPSKNYETYPWDAGTLVQEVIRRVGNKIRFYVVDVAEKEDGGWLVMELNDGQQSGLSTIDPYKFYRSLKEKL
jgi:hypothetical protein